VSDARPVGVFDSGVGGLTVLSEILRRLPNEPTIYLCDNARTPYGVRSVEEIRRFSGEALDELAARDVKAIVVACNSSSAAALGYLRERYDIPILGVIRPGAAAAALATRNGRVGVIATPATVRSRAYFAAIKDENPALHVYEQPAPELVPLVEAGQLDGPAVTAAVRRSLAPLFRLPDSDDLLPYSRAPEEPIDTLLLGCTHYPLLRSTIVSVVGAGTAVVDSAAATASSLAELLGINGLDAPPATSVAHHQLTTGDADRFAGTARRLFGATFGDGLGADPTSVSRVELGAQLAAAEA
jgi:glutamate racemase